MFEAGVCINKSKKDNKNPFQNGHGSKASSGKHKTNGSSHTSNAIVTKSGKHIDRASFVRVLIQSLNDLGWSKAASQLEAESGIHLESMLITEFRKGIEKGNWDKVNAIIPQLQLESKEHKTKIAALIGEQKFLELLERSCVTQALEFLREQLVPLHPNPARLHELTSFIMYSTDPVELRKRAKWTGAKGNSRKALLKKIQAYIPSSVLVPHSRLLYLLDDALDYQVLLCNYHNTQNATFNLLQSHECSLGIPQESQYVLDHHTDEVLYLKFSNDGTRLASGSADQTIMIWDNFGTKEKPSRSLVLTGCTEAISYLAWSPKDDMMLTCGNGNDLRIWETKTGETRLEIPNHHQEDITACAWLSDGKGFVTGSIDKNIIIWDLSGNAKYTWTGDMIRDIAICGSRMLVATTEQTLCLYDIDSKGKECFQDDELSPITSLCLSSDGKYALVNTTKPAEIHLWNLETQIKVRTFEGFIQNVFIVRSAFGGIDDNFVICGSEDAQVYIWHRHSGKLLRKLPGHAGTINSVAWSPTNCNLFASGSDDTTIRIWGCGSEKINASKMDQGRENMVEEKDASSTSGTVA